VPFLNVYCSPSLGLLPAVVGELAYLYDPTSYTGGSSLPAGSPMPDRSKGRGQTKRTPQMVFLAAGERLLQ